MKARSSVGRRAERMLRDLGELPPEEAKKRTKTQRLAGKDQKARNLCKADARCLFADETCRGPLQWAHVFSRGILVVRHDPENDACLCEDHHTRADANRRAFRARVEKMFPGRIERLRLKMRTAKSGALV